MPPDDEPLHLFPAAPARVLAAAIPLAALLLVSIGAARGAMDPGADSPLSPWIVALAGADAAWVTGQVITVDGGLDAT